MGKETEGCRRKSSGTRTGSAFGEKKTDEVIPVRASQPNRPRKEQHQARLSFAKEEKTGKMGGKMMQLTQPKHPPETVLNIEKLVDRLQGKKGLQKCDHEQLRQGERKNWWLMNPTRP